MTDSHLSSTEQGTIAVAVNRCLMAFKGCMLQAATIHPRELSMVEDQLAEFYAWAGGIGVFAPARASLDYRLRHAREEYSVVIGLLESLNHRTESCLDRLNLLVGSSDIDDSSEIDPVFVLALKQIASQIRHLNRASSIIRRTLKDAQTLIARDFQIKDDKGHNIESFLLQSFKGYIKGQFPDSSHVIQDRLADAMIVRRKRIIYRRSRAGHGAQAQVPSTDREVSVESSAEVASKAPKDSEATHPNFFSSSVLHSKVQSTTILDQKIFRSLPSSSLGVAESKTATAQTHENLDFPPLPPPDSARRKKHGMLLRHKEDIKPDAHSGRGSQEGEAAIDNIRKKEMGEVTCPYCLQVLSAEEVLNEEKWQLHVKNDLYPYVCLSATCTRPKELYNHRERWIRHMQDHTRTWSCISHREAGLFTTRKAYIEHLKETHTTKLNSTQLTTLANRNSRKAPRLFDSCVLCGQHESALDSRMEDHIASHLISLALKSLPSFDEHGTGPGTPETESVGRNNTSRALTSSTSKSLSDWDRDKLVFEAHERSASSNHHDSSPTTTSSAFYDDEVNLQHRRVILGDSSHEAINRGATNYDPYSDETIQNVTIAPRTPPPQLPESPHDHLLLPQSINKRPQTNIAVFVAGRSQIVQSRSTSPVWDELEDIQSRIKNLEAHGKSPSTSGAAAWKLADGQPSTATSDDELASQDVSRDSKLMGFRSGNVLEGPAEGREVLSRLSKSDIIAGQQSMESTIDLSDDLSSILESVADRLSRNPGDPESELNDTFEAMRRDDLHRRLDAVGSQEGGDRQGSTTPHMPIPRVGKEVHSARQRYEKSADLPTHHLQGLPRTKAKNWAGNPGLLPFLEDQHLSGSMNTEEQSRENHQSGQERLSQSFQGPSSRPSTTRGTPFPSEQASPNNALKVKDKGAWVTDSFPEYHLHQGDLELYLNNLFKDSQITVKRQRTVYIFKIPRVLSRENRDEIGKLRW